MIKTNYKKAMITTELVVTLAIVTIISIAMAKLISVIGRANLIQLTRQQCIAATQAQLDCIAATDQTIPQADFQRLWPHITSAVTRTSGTGQWQGLEFVEVTSISDRTRKSVKVTLCRYITPPPEK